MTKPMEMIVIGDARTMQTSQLSVSIILHDFGQTGLYGLWIPGRCFAHRNLKLIKN